MFAAVLLGLLTFTQNGFSADMGMGIRIIFTSGMQQASRSDSTILIMQKSAIR